MGTGITITNVYNDSVKEGTAFKKGMGNAFLIQTHAENLLFDVGWNGKNLLHNLSLCQITPKDISQVIVSHGHMDHTMGFKDFLSSYPELSKLTVVGHPDLQIPKKVQIILPFIGFFSHFYQIYQKYKSQINWEFSAEAKEIVPNLWFSGEIRPRPYEPSTEPILKRKSDHGWEEDPLSDDISLYFIDDDKLTILCGCAHAGLLNICQHAKSLFPDKKIRQIIGGTHMKHYSKERLISVLDELTNTFDEPELFLNHCTGKEILKQLPLFYNPAKIHSFQAGNSLTL